MNPAQEDPGPALWAAFLAFLGMALGFAVLTGRLVDWAAHAAWPSGLLESAGTTSYGGFCVGLITAGFLAERLGSRVFFILAGASHAAGLVLLILHPEATPAAPLWGLFFFALGSGVLEGVVNPMVAALEPPRALRNLNLARSGWPAGLLLGGLMGQVLPASRWHWELAFTALSLLGATILLARLRPSVSPARHPLASMRQRWSDVGCINALLLGGLCLLFFRRAFGADIPAVAAAMALTLLMAWVSGGTRGSRGLALLLVMHGMVGVVELSTDGILRQRLAEAGAANFQLIAFGLLCGAMFAIRLAIGLSSRPGLEVAPRILLASSLAAAAGLCLASFGPPALRLLGVALLGAGRAALWPSMLALAAQRFPGAGAIALALIGGAGVLTAGMIGTPLLTAYPALAIAALAPLGLALACAVLLRQRQRPPPG